MQKFLMCIPLYLPTCYIHVTVCILSSSDKSARLIHWFTFLKAHASVEWLMGRIYPWQVYLLMVIHRVLSDSKGHFQLICGLEWYLSLVIKYMNLHCLKNKVLSANVFDYFFYLPLMLFLLNGECFYGYYPDVSDEESEYEVEYEILSAGSAEPWDDADGGWISADGLVAATGTAESSKQKENGSGGEVEPSTLESQLPGVIEREEIPGKDEADRVSETDRGTTYNFEDLEQLMAEIGNVRDSLRLMPDFQRREMAANLAMKMAAMFGDSSGDEEGLD